MWSKDSLYKRQLIYEKNKEFQKQWSINLKRFQKKHTEHYVYNNVLIILEKCAVASYLSGFPPIALVISGFPYVAENHTKKYTFELVSNSKIQRRTSAEKHWLEICTFKQTLQVFRGATVSFNPYPLGHRFDVRARTRVKDYASATNWQCFNWAREEQNLEHYVSCKQRAS